MARMQGNDVYMGNHKVGEVRGNEIWEARSNSRIGEVKGNEIWDTRNRRRIAEVRGNEIRDAQTHRQIGTLDDAFRDIQGAVGGVRVAAVWLLLVR